MQYFTFIGNHDFIGPDNPGMGAAMTIFNSYKDDLTGVYIFATPGKYKEMSEKIKRQMLSLSDHSDLNITIVDLDIDSPVDFDLVYKALLDGSRTVIENDKLQEEEIVINITSGTPTMSTCWVLLAKANLIPNAKLIQSFETQFQRKYGKPCREVNLEIDDFPHIVSPDKVKRELNKVSKELEVLKEEKTAQKVDNQIPDMIGSSRGMRNIKDQIIKLVDQETHVLIIGEPGTGKEVVAKSIWNLYRKENDRNQVTFDCGSIPPNLIHSEIFGHVKGAFTGADRTKKGIIEENDGKMIFLDEIGNIPRENQNVFMRLLQMGEIKKSGSNQVETVNVQIIAATNKDINDPDIFASDLRDRFDEVIVLPSLRDRKDDIPQLVDHFLKLSDKNVSFSKDVYDELLKFSWPANVRQLRTWVKRMCRYFKNQKVRWKEIPENIRPDLPSHLDDSIQFPDFPINFKDYTEQLRFRALEIARGNNSQADRLLGFKDGNTKQWIFQRKNRK